MTGVDKANICHSWLICFTIFLHN